MCLKVVPMATLLDTSERKHIAYAFQEFRLTSLIERVMIYIFNT